MSGNQNANNFEHLEKVHELIFWFIDFLSKQEPSKQVFSIIQSTVSFLYTSGYWKQLEILLNTGVMSAKTYGDRASLIDCCHLLALLYTHQDSDELVLNGFRRVNSILQESKEWPELAFVLYALGMWFERKGNAENAYRIYKQVLELPETSSDCFILSAFRFGELAFELNDFVTAKQAYQLAFDVFSLR